MNKSGFLKKLRMYLADPLKKVWKDEYLNDILEESLKQYCFDSGVFTGHFYFHPDASGVYHYPEDFLRFKAGFNRSGDEIVPTTGRELFVNRGIRNKSGTPVHIYDDLSSTGEFCLYPDPSIDQRYEDIYFDSEYGEVMTDDFGVYTEGFGTTLSMNFFEFSGELFYIKCGIFEDIKDHDSIIYYALYLCYNSDNDFCDANIARGWFMRYKSRIGAFSGIEHSNVGMVRTGNFY